MLSELGALVTVHCVAD